jgi:hypothetical protein
MTLLGLLTFSGFPLFGIENDIKLVKDLTWKKKRQIKADKPVLFLESSNNFRNYLETILKNEIRREKMTQILREKEKAENSHLEIKFSWDYSGRITHVNRNHKWGKKQMIYNRDM